jgi:hypothetical protein
MARPSCRLHQAGRVERRGYYGKDNEFIRWVCVTANGGRRSVLGRGIIDRTESGKGQLASEDADHDAVQKVGCGAEPQPPALPATVLGHDGK